jgi:lysozyme
MTALILDVSSYQGTGIDWKRVKRAGFAGVFVKATEGAGYVNPSFRAQAAGARAAGLRVGFYHFARPDNPNDATTEAAHFANVTAGHRTRADLRPVLDYETWWGPALEPGRTVQMGAPGVEKWPRTWIQTVKHTTGDLAIFYSGLSFIERLAPKTTIGFGLWLAAYGSNDGIEHPYRVPKPWKRAVLHQFTSQGRVPGVPGKVDVSRGRSLRPLLAHPIAGLV